MLGSKYKIGQEIIINIPDENWSWGYRPVSKQNGVTGVITGFGTIVRERINNFGHKPGLYENKAWIYVTAEGKLPFSISCCFIKPVKPEDCLATSEEKFLAELEETKFWEGDIISTAEYPRIKIVGVKYGWNKEGEPMLYDISDDFGCGWYTSVREDMATLIERGNVWKYYHNEPMTFKDIEEEANFYKLLGLYDEVRNPRNNKYSWSLEEILDAIKEGYVDALSVSNGFMGMSSPHNSAIKFRNEDLGNRVRPVVLKGFNK